MWALWHLFIWSFWTVAVLSSCLILYRRFKKEPSLKGKHVVITGGSSGIGKGIGISAAKRGAHVTIIARQQKRLDEAKQEISLAVIDHSQIIRTISLDITKDYTDVEKALVSLDEEAGPVYMLVNCAGAAVCGRLEDITPSDIQLQISLNLLGTLYVTKALIGRMKSRNEGIIVVTGSQATLLGIYGLSIYSSTKFALRGFAESLHMEVKAYGMSVTLAVPPDTDTPGFAQEQKTKPLETRIISETAGLLDPVVVGEQIVKDSLRGKFFSYVGFESSLVCLVCAGMSPLTSVVQVLFEAAVMGPLRLVSAVYLIYFNAIIKKCKYDRNKNKKIE